MDELWEAERKTLQKLSTERVISKLVQYGEVESDIETLDRTLLLDMLAKHKLAELLVRGEMEEGAVGGVSQQSDVELASGGQTDLITKQDILSEKDPHMRKMLADIMLEQQRIFSERERAEKEAKFERERAENEAERQAIAAEKRAQREHEQTLKFHDAELQLKLAQAERELAQTAEIARLQREHESDLKHQELIAAEKRQAEKNSVAMQVKNFGTALRNSLGTMPDDAVDIITYLNDFETQATRLEVPKTLLALIIRPFLSKRAKIIVSRMSDSDSADYDKLKDNLLKELQLTARSYWQRFQMSSKREEETYTAWASKLEATLNTYVTSRAADTWDKLKSLLIADKIKASIETSGPGRHILSIEAQKTDQEWLDHKALARALDAFVAARPMKIKMGEPEKEHDNKNVRPPRNGSNRPWKSRKPEKNSASAGNQWYTKTPSDNRCLVCKEDGCRKRFHDFRTGKLRPEYADGKGKLLPKFRTVRVARAQQEPVNTGELNISRTAVRVREIKMADSGISVQPEKVEVVQLFMRTEGDENVQKISGIIDSGAEVMIVKEQMLQQLNLHIQPQGKTRIRGIIGEGVSATLFWCYLRLPGHKSEVPVICATCKELNEEVIIPLTVIARLRAVEREEESENQISLVQTRSMNQKQLDQMQEEVDEGVSHGDEEGQNVEEVQQEKGSSVDSLKKEQQECETLKKYRQMAVEAEAESNAEFFIKGGILYRRGKVKGCDVHQVCLPKCRRKEVFRLAHDTCHLSAGKVIERITASFWWPKIWQNVQTWTSTCSVCQTKKRVTYIDRVPISPLPIGQVPFQEMVADCFGPILPETAGVKPVYNFCFIMVDRQSRFCFAHPLRSLNAATICDTLLEIFSFTGVPSTIQFDNASNFTAKLTKEFLAKLHCVPKYGIPYHPQNQGLAERYIGTIKSIVSKLAAEHPKQWHKEVKFAVWALREVSNATTGLSPWLMIFGRQMRGPCAILADLWTEEATEPLNLGRPTVEYLLDLRQNIENAVHTAEDNAREAGNRYAAQHNKRSKDKYFNIGDLVLILTPDQTSSAMFSRWQGPARVMQKTSTHGYLVNLNGVQREIHADRMRKYNIEVTEVETGDPLLGQPPTDSESNLQDSSPETDAEYQVNACAIVEETDEQFGDICPVETDQRVETLPSQRIPPEKLQHLSEQQKRELCEVLDKHSVCFSETPGYTTKAVHHIKLNNDFQPRVLAQYKIPEKLKADVHEQIGKMIDQGIIESSDSPMISPLVCVRKSDKVSVRLAVDYRFINKFTVPDPFPVPEIIDILQEIAGASWYSTFDFKSGYWQTPVAPEDRWKTAFVADGELYQFTRTPFGAKNSGSTFIRALKSILKPVEKFTKSYVDDVVVFSMQWQKHLQEIDSFLQQVEESGMTLSLNKCNFCLKEVRFCGWLIGDKGRRPDPEKIAAIMQLRPASDKKGIRRLCGIFGYFRDFIPEYARIALPLTDLTKKGIPNAIPWGPEQDQALDKLKQELCNASETHLDKVDLNREFHLYCDASERVVSGALTQIDEHGKEYPISFYSRKLDGNELNWPIIQKEAFSSIHALQKFKQWVWGSRSVVIHSDHNPLLYLTQNAPKNARLVRWTLALQDFPVTWKFKQGFRNVVADALTRC